MTYLAEIASRVRAEVPAPLVPAESDDLFLVYAVLVLATGTRTTARSVHDAWTAWMLSRGESHDSMVPFDDLPPAIQREDEPFVDAIHRVASEHLVRP